jgi:hypothetical protein
VPRESQGWRAKKASLALGVKRASKAQKENLALRGRKDLRARRANKAQPDNKAQRENPDLRGCKARRARSRAFRAQPDLPVPRFYSRPRSRVDATSDWFNRDDSTERWVIQLDATMQGPPLAALLLALKNFDNLTSSRGRAASFSERTAIPRSNHCDAARCVWRKPSGGRRLQKITSPT